MNRHSPLENLHKEFVQALQSHVYLGPDQNDPTKLTRTPKKTIYLCEVFKLAIDQIDITLKPINSPSKPTVDHLRLLQRDGKVMYERYTKATNSWSRWFLKGLARITPELLSPFLPSCFSNEMEKAEKNTQEEYEKYQRFIREKISALSPKSPILEDQKTDNQVEQENVLVQEEDIFDPQQDEMNDDKKKSEPQKQEMKKPESKQPVEKNDPAKEKQLQELRKKRLIALQTDDYDDQDADLQNILEQIYGGASSNLITENLKSDTVTQLNDLDDWDELNDLDDLHLSEYLSEYQENDEILDEREQANAKTSKPFSLTQLKHPSLITPIATPSKEEIEKARQKGIHTALQNLRNGLQCIQQFADYPLSRERYINVLIRMANATSIMMHLDPDAQSSLEKVGIKDKTFEVLRDSSFQAALYLRQFDQIGHLLQSTSWHDSFTEAMAQEGHIKFGVRKVVGQVIMQLANAEGQPVKEKDFQNYRGSVHLVLTDFTLLSEMEELVKVLNTSSSCRPCHVVIKVQNPSSLTPEFFQLLLKLKEQVAEIKVEGVQEINFQTLALSEADEHLFVQHLEKFQFSDLKSLTLSNHPKKDWTANDFSLLLAFCFTSELLKDCYRLCPSYQDIVIPIQFTTSTAIDFTGFNLDQISYLLSQCSDLTYANFSGLPMTDNQLFQWMQQGFLANVKTLHFKGCPNLTTDSLPVLANLPQLARVSLPDLPKGKLPLNQLPKFDNPFKIKMLYTTSQATQSLASGLYTGPQLWAPIFQIPLARQGVPNVFTQKRLDPKSVAYWLHQNDYQHLKPQTSVLTILADSNEKLTDENLVEFVKKFPETVGLSLYNCPHVSDTGIINLLKECPTIKNIDLMGCPHITESLFFEPGHEEVLNKLHKLIITDTGISRDIATLYKDKEKMGPRLVFEEATLTISDDDLIDEDALEKILSKQDLTKLKRINLEKCTKLNNKILGQLLDHLNAPTDIQTQEGTWIDNPQRLNLAILNLSGCSNITDEAFDQIKQTEITDADNVPLDQIKKPKFEPKFLENLDRIVIGGTKISQVLKLVYPNVTFQEFEEPITIQIDEEKQLQDCIAYHEKKAQHALNDDEEKELIKLSACYLHNRIAVELFCENEDLAHDILSQTIKPDAEEFCDFTLTFKEEDHADPSLIHVHRDALYSQSLYFVNGLRPGGKFSKIGGTVFTNVHANPEAVQAVKNLLYGKLCIENLDWRTAADVAELVGPKIFHLASGIYNALLARIHSQFSIDEAHEMFEAAEALEDNQGKEEYEKTLLFHLENLGEMDDDNFQKIANLGRGYGLKELNAQVEIIQKNKTDAINRQLRAEEAKKNEKLIQRMKKAGQLTDFV